MGIGSISEAVTLYAALPLSATAAGISAGASGRALTGALVVALATAALAQAALGARVIARMLATAHGQRITPAAPNATDERITVLIPVLDEHQRLAPCLDGAIAQGPVVAEILVIDGGSTDGTQELVSAYMARDTRVRLLDASPIPPTWNGKAWGLDYGLRHAANATRWVLTLDADVLPTPPLADALLAHALRCGVAALSVATRQILSSVGEGFIHPALLTTLVYRFGSPGHATRRITQAQANGQCMLFRRAALARVGGFAAVRESICEDITIARALAATGELVGFYEGGDLVAVHMYSGGRDAWRNWSRSLPMRDRYFGLAGALGLLEVLFVQALPLPALAATLILTPSLWRIYHMRPLSMLALGAALTLEAALLALRVGALAGVARAYRRIIWSYWFSPLLDLPVAIQLWLNALRRRHRWRGRVIIRGGLT